jgi:hypothetical protein
MSVVTIDGNTADGLAGSGGGVLNVSGGTVTIANSTISNNSSQRAGGGVEANGSNTTLWNTALLGNSTGAVPGNGGGLHLTGVADIHVVGGEVSGNTAASEGGGLWNSAGGTMFVRNTTLDGNTASGAAADNGGGALFNDGGTLTVRNTSMDGNAADGAAGSGGAILNNGGTLSVDLSTLSSNTSSRAGGGIETVAGSTIVGRSMLVANETGPAPGNGGALHVTGAGDVDVFRTLVQGNIAASEGGGLWNGSATMDVINSIILENTASGAAADNGGGGLFNNLGTLNVSGSRIDFNIANGASGSGGGIFNDQGLLTVVDTGIRDNESNRAGGGIEANVGTTDLDLVTMYRNVTGAAPGNGGAFHVSGGTFVNGEGAIQFAQKTPRRFYVFNQKSAQLDCLLRHFLRYDIKG